ncbi:MAG TPA: deoxyribonuclease IV [Gemmatimonadota bacterium]|nr:deoxyribonuclease IV [Gemmatimonadota bacterium]
MLLLGAHMSTAGGLHTAFERGEALGCTTIQIFTSSPRQWRGRKLTDRDVDAFRAAWDASSCRECFAHDIYLTRLGTRDRAICSRSRSTFAEEIRTCQRLGLSALVMHPVGDDDANEDAVLDRVAASLNAVFDEVPDEGTLVLLETTAGQGANVGYRFEQLARIIENVEQDGRLGICVDTCHVFAAGYDISGKTGWKRMMSELESTVGFTRLKALHLNDSRKPCGSRVDRHAHIGRGEIGKAAFERVMRDRRLVRVPKVIETPKENDMDAVNLRLLRELAGKQ